MKKDFHKEYKNYMTEQTPDLWNRIENGISEKPIVKRQKKHHKRRYGTYALTAAAALLVVMSVQSLYNGMGANEKRNTNTAADMMMQEAAPAEARDTEGISMEEMPAEEAAPEEAAPEDAETEKKTEGFTDGQKNASGDEGKKTEQQKSGSEDKLNVSTEPEQAQPELEQVQPETVTLQVMVLGSKGTAGNDGVLLWVKTIGQEDDEMLLIKADIDMKLEEGEIYMIDVLPGQEEDAYDYEVLFAE